MRAVSKGGSIVKVEVEELNVVDVEVLSSWGDDSVRARSRQEFSF